MANNQQSHEKQREGFFYVKTHNRPFENSFFQNFISKLMIGHRNLEFSVNHKNDPKISARS